MAVIEDGAPLKVKGYGLSDIENNKAINSETIFQSDSIGKQFTAIAILQLKEEDKLELDDKIDKYYEGAHESLQSISIRNLFAHTSGIWDWECDPSLINLQEGYKEEELLKKPTIPLNFEPR